MARKSKRLHTNHTEHNHAIKKCYQAGIYARLSSDQEEKKNESIEGQIEIAKKFVEDWNQSHTDQIEVVDHFIDLGKTGTNFHREAFGRLMQEIRLGEINCVIVKDVSRFGRNYLEAGNYIEKIFPFLGVRFIAISDGYDTGVEGNDTKKMALEIKNLIHDRYAKDFSKKAKIGLKQRREEGSYVGGPAPYGYLSIWEGRRRKLIPDENTADVVRYIYEQFLKTECYTAVTHDLNKRNINPPTVYKKTKEVYCPPNEDYKGWEKGSVERILKSETYIGKLVQGKSTITARDEKNRIQKDSQEWVITEHAHEGLIDREIFEKAAEIHQKIQKETEKKKSHIEGYPIEENMFDDVLYCGVCGRKMTRSSHVKYGMDGTKIRKEGYFCWNSTSMKTKDCPNSNHISKRKLMDILFVLIEKEFSMNLRKQKIYLEKGREYIQQAKLKLERECQRVEHKLAALKEEESETYLNYRMGVLSQKEYVSYKMKKEEQLQELETKKLDLTKRQKQFRRDSEEYEKVVRSLLKWKQEKELIEILIEKIYLYPDKRVEVVFSYTNPLIKRGTET